MRRTGYLLDRVYSFSEQKLQVMMRALLCLLALAASPVPAQQTSDTGAAVDLTTSLRPRARSSGAQGDAEPANRYASASSLNWEIENGDIAKGSGLRLIYGAPLSDYLAIELHGGLGGGSTVSGTEVELKELLARTDNFEQKLDISRRWNNDRRFQVGVQCLRGVLQPADAGQAFSNVAETALAGLYPAVEEEFVRRHGHIQGASMVVLALGKLGSREMMASSDLDLIFIYATPGDDGLRMSDGEHPLEAVHYFARLSQRLISALTALTSEGRLYEVDMRLRPSGAKGPIASTLGGFIQYHADAAWTWERMALTRARTLLGPDDLRESAATAIRDILTTPWDPNALLRDVADMRRRLDRENHTECLWALKPLRGGIVDIEFIAQFVALAER